jgi:small-conductance mechanosensitive channel
VFLFAIIIFGIIQKVIVYNLEKWSKKTQTDVDDTVVKIAKSLRPTFYQFIAFYLALQTLNVNELVEKVIFVIIVAWVVYQVTIVFQIVIDFVANKQLDEEKDKHGEAAVRMLTFLAKVALWSIAFIMILSNLGIDVTSLVTGLGIGGIAVALAVQNILGDLFSSFSIYFDKPFKVGDFIVVGTDAGTVQEIGIKSTRIKTLQGEMLVISNKELTTVRVQNYKPMNERRVVSKIGVTYDTSNKQLQKIPQIIESIVEGVENLRFSRCHFCAFGESMLEIETVYFVETSDYNTHMDAQQEFFLKVKEAFEKEKIEFAFPTRTVHVVK